MDVTVAGNDIHYVKKTYQNNVELFLFSLLSNLVLLFDLKDYVG